MRDLLQFIKKYSVLLLFLLLEILSLALVFHSGNSRYSAFFSSASVISAKTYEAQSSVIDFFKLKSANQTLAEENSALKNKITKLENDLAIEEEKAKGADTVYVPAENELEYIPAKVINSSTTKLKNYITINKGRRDGIEPDMGVVCANGAVGVVKCVSDKFAVILPILNPDFKLNCRFKSNNYAGPLVWNGKDYRYAELQEIARHVKVRQGDEIVTSGLTSIFPEGIKVGNLVHSELSESEAYYTLKVKLSVNFRTLSYVQVIKNKNLPEQVKLEKEAEEGEQEE